LGLWGEFFAKIGVEKMSGMGKDHGVVDLVAASLQGGPTSPAGGPERTEPGTGESVGLRVATAGAGELRDGGAESAAGLPGIVRELGDLGAGAVITESALAKMLHRHPVSVRRAVRRGELPPGCRMFNATCWTVGSILSHIEGRLAEARKAREAMLKKISQISS
jgi:hypothetical protein